MATAPQHSAFTRSARPQPWLGSTMTGRWDSLFATATAPNQACCAYRFRRSGCRARRAGRWGFHGQNVFGGEQPFLDAFAHSALQQDRLAASRALDEQLEVLRVSRADLKDVRDLRDVLYVAFAEHLGDDLQTGFLRAAASNRRPSLPQALEFVGRRARFVSAAAQHGRAPPPSRPQPC